MEDNKLHNIRHSLSHLMSMAVVEFYPSAGLGVGPVIEDGFYQDYDLPEAINDTILPKLEKRMRELIKKNITFAQHNMDFAEAFKLYKKDPYKTELIEDLKRAGEKKVSFYKSGEFDNLCLGPHVKTTREINPEGFKLMSIAGSYWRGSEKNKMLTRIYGVAFGTKQDLADYLVRLEESKKRDHKKLGRELDLFLIDEKVGKGLPMWTPRGTAVKFELEKFTRDLEKKYGYEHVATPYLGAEELYRTSGHLDHYTANMYSPIDMDGDKFYLRPMACPHHIRMYQRKSWSYKELPVRYAEIADYNRYEKSGELMGMTRVRKFQLTDGHLFVASEGLKEEFKRVCNMIVEGIKGLGLLDIVSYRFSKRDPKNTEKYYPDNKLWNHAESLMKEALDELGLPYITALDEAAFYGPKLDVQAKNVHGKEDTLFTAQMDFLLPQKFDMEYVDAQGERKRPVMIHRSTIGCLERTFGFLIEHYGGAFPLWLSPTQVVVIPISEKFIDYTKNIETKLKNADVRVVLDDQSETLGKRIRNNKMLKIPYIIVIGQKEIDFDTITAESRDKGQIRDIKIADFIVSLKEEITQRR